MAKTDLKVFELPGVGRVIGDLSRPDMVPVIQFEDGTQTFGLPRSEAEAAALGYDNIAEANFVHEAAHLFIMDKLGWTDRSVLYRAGKGCTFTKRECLNDAMREERIVLGFQVAVNDVEGDGLTTNKAGGFLLHLAGAAREYAREQLFANGWTFGMLLPEFYSLLIDAGVTPVIPKAVKSAALWPEAEGAVA